MFLCHSVFKIYTKEGFTASFFHGVILKQWLISAALVSIEINFFYEGTNVKNIILLCLYTWTHRCSKAWMLQSPQFSARKSALQLYCLSVCKILHSFSPIYNGSCTWTLTMWLLQPYGNVSKDPGESTLIFFSDKTNFDLFQSRVEKTFPCHE